MLVLYAGSLRYPPVFDDRVVGLPGLPHYRIAWMHLEPRWLSYGTLGFTHLFAGFDMLWYRLGNVLLHFATALAALRLVEKLLFEEKARSALRLAAFLGALAFALHPVAVYGVAYLAQRSIVMATLFSLLSLAAAADALRQRSVRAMWLAVLWYFLAVWSKEHAVMLPALLVPLAVALGKRELRLAKHFAAPLAGFAVVGILVVLRVRGLLGATYEPYSAEILSPAAASPYLASVITQGHLFFKYLGLWLLPYPGWMSVDLRVPLAAAPLAWPQAAGFAAYLAYGALATWLLFRRSTGASLAGFLLLAPWLLYFTEFAATRVQEPFVLYRSYLWFAASFAALVALAVLRLPARAALAGALALCLAFGIAARERVESFSSPQRLWDDAVRKNDPALPFADRALGNRGVSRMQANDLERALADFDLAIRLNPSNTAALVSRGTARSQLGRLQEAMRDFDAAIAANPGMGEAYAERCALRLKLDDAVAAFPDCEKAVALNPYYLVGVVNRGVLHGRAARHKEALGDFERVLALEPGHAPAHFNRGQTLLALGRQDEARAAFARSCALGFQPACQAR